MFKELTAVLLPGGRLDLEWTGVEEAVDKGQQILQEELSRRFAEDYGSFLLFLGFADPSVPLSASLDFWRRVAAAFTHALVKTPDLEALRHKASIVISDDQIAGLLEKAPFVPGFEYLNGDVIPGLCTVLNATWQRQIRAYKGTVEEFIRTYRPQVHLVGRVFFHLVESKKDLYPFAFLATYSTGLSQAGASRHLPLRHALTEYGQDSSRMLDLLTTVQLAATESPFVSELLSSGEIFHPLALSAKEAHTILREIPLYERCGVLCRIPNWWKDRSAGLRVEIRIGDTRPATLGMDAILDFKAALALGDEAVSEEEIRRLLEESEGLALIKGRWVEVDRDRLQQTLQAYEQAQAMMAKGELTLREAMRLQLRTGRDLGLAQEQVDCSVSHGQWLASVMDRLHSPQRIDTIALPKAFKARLRPYQHLGLDWLGLLDSLQLGACLADDMGLGKTVQLLALLSVLKDRCGHKQQVTSLLVVPASLIGNWVSEIERFAPSLQYIVAHPGYGNDKADLKTDPKVGPDLGRTDLVITTYGMCQKNAWLKDRVWDLVVLDEAQAIKNPGTQQTRAVKQIKARNRIAMTGTPIENRLSDLWSLFDFLNPGLLGTAKEFADLAKTLRKDPSGYARLKKVVNPYILRRLKTDKSVIADLPDKIEVKIYADMARKQIVLYQDLVRQIKEQLEERPEGIRRKGLILAALMKFKQLCNHPDQYLGQSEFVEDHSGKFQRLRPICETVLDKHERMLVFTQFKEMTGPLDRYLQGLFGHEGLVLHGGTPVAKRRSIVERFQGDEYVPYMVLSLKAGGVGLNLTAASHVVHFDRWWNPAVENQATDRAFRIGQTRNVVVHKFVTRGTVEEKIDAMLLEKAGLAQEILPASGEAWVTEMDNKQLMDLFTLSL
jgi:superfamily II DNA or RNA helicase